ncbi:hypothetical protein [Streptomyces mirabilis]|uniref:hypothetical protein n=1 Tax=Streptomyces mirabilis TaxID=68239 RepID=UPI0036889CE2
MHLNTRVLLGFVPSLREAELPPDALLLAFLPLLLYWESYWESVTTSLRAIRRDLRGIVLTGKVLVAITAWAVAALTHAYGLPWGAASTLGAAVAPTDAKIRTIPGSRSAQAPPHGAFSLVRAKRTVYHQQTENILCSYSPQKLGLL